MIASIVKTVLVLGTVGAASFANASNYFCRSADGETEGRLKVTGAREIIWSDVTHAAVSRGVFVGLDTAPYSPRKGEMQYNLVNFYRSNDQHYVLSVSPKLLQNPKSVVVTVFMDNDDHAEEVTDFNCRAL